MSVKKKKANNLKVAEQVNLKSKLALLGLTFAEIDRIYDLTSGAAREALRVPNARSERAIAAALGTRPHLLWRSRYHASGQRRSPQDYERPPTLAQRRKEQAA